MMQSLHWPRALKSPEAETQLRQMQTEALWLFLALAALGYLGWNTVYPWLWSTDEGVTHAYIILPAALPVLGGTWLLLPHSQRAATAVFIGGGLLAISWALYITNAAQATVLYAMLALVAAFVVHPLGGGIVVGATIGLLTLLGTVRPGLVGPAEVWSTALYGILGVVGVHALTRHLFLALNWYVDGYAEAERRSREAQEHRAQLVQALRQLDNAYYRLERANAALQVAWKAADEAERSKMELATNISHELRTPLNLIIGYSEMMITSPGSYGGVALPAPYRGDLNAIYRSAQHLLALTDDVLDLAQLEVGRLGLLREPVDLGQVVRDAATLVREYAEAKGLELRLALPENLPTLLLDRLRIRQVLLNLLTNAARLTERGTIQVQLVRREHDVLVQVTDTGPGIAPDDLPRIFQRFVTRDRPRPDWHSGTGLGLPISKRFIELHGGEMGVESALGVGTTFWFTLPHLPLAAVPDRVPVGEGTGVRAPLGEGTGHERYIWTVRGAATAASSLGPAYLRQPEPVLILAHAEAGLARVFQRHLEGFRIEIADTLADAAVRAREQRATAIVADLDAPVEGTGSPVPVVRCPLPHIGRLAKGLGVADYLVKPIFREALVEAIQRLKHPIRRVLIVDDDPRFVRFLSRMLGSEAPGYQVSTAHNGEEALVRMRADPPDLLLLDLTMPGLDGVGVLREMGAAPGLASVKVIVVSAHGEGEGMVPLGGEVRISKPEGFHLGELTQVIGAAIGKLAPVRAHLST
ncbi:MAG: hybrid sensor histidine kinase/response regulator [Chloroflexi bacterium]|nr:hybrid sensor histidine kinase/response regulator [Chloroflexota bacterium]